MTTPDRSGSATAQSRTTSSSPRPGAGAAAFLRLADLGVNVALLLPVRIPDGEFFAVICADDAAAAERALGDQVITE